MKKNGFTLIELLVVITIIGILASIALPNYIRAKNKAKEVQVKSSVHNVQTAVERYAVDNGDYPPFLIGGDVEGWRHWHTRFPSSISIIPSARYINDPLIIGGYLDSYPKNPFISNGMAVVAQTGHFNPPPEGYKAGDGDPRFGFNGTIMGNGISDPKFFKRWYQDMEYQSVATELTLDLTAVDPFQKGFLDEHSSPAGLHYTFGGRRNGGTTIALWWPGNFFYVGYQEILVARKGWTVPIPGILHGGSNFYTYIIGGYGDYQTEGLDAIRLEETDSTGQQIYWKLPSAFGTNFEFMVPCTYYIGQSFMFSGRPGGLPTCAGGGNEFAGPLWPHEYVDHKFIVGAPDGVPDGVLLVLSSNQDSSF